MNIDTIQIKNHRLLNIQGSVQTSRYMSVLNFECFVY